MVSSGLVSGEWWIVCGGVVSGGLVSGEWWIVCGEWWIVCGGLCVVDCEL